MVRASVWVRDHCKFAATGRWKEGDTDAYVAGLKTSDQIRPGFVTVYDKEFYENGKNRVFVSQDGMQGFALLNHGDGRTEIAGVFNNDPKKKGAGRQTVLDAFSMGGNYLEAFEGNEKFSLPAYYYSLIGAEPQEYVPFDEQHAHPEWQYDRYGRPGLVTLRVPEGAHSDPKWLEREKVPAKYKAMMDQAKERAMKKDEKRAGKVVSMRRFAFGVEDPIEAYEQWEQETNAAFAKKEAAKKKLRVVK